MLTDLYHLGNFIDTFALGHYARVLEAIDRRTNQPVALKVMRPEHIDDQPRWESEAFLHEADLLKTLADLPTVMQFYDCGYLASSETYPDGGEVQSFGLDLDAFRAHYYPALAKGWRPYLALELLPRYNNLLYVMKPSQTGERWRLPTEEGLDLALQFGELLYKAHQRGIVYLDHKLEHVYWDGQRLRIIDWNSSRRVNGAGESTQITNDLHNLCVGILYPVFTGQAPQLGSLRPQPASQAEVDSRYENITSLNFDVEPTLSRALRSALEAGAQKRYENATAFLGEFQRIAVRFGWGFPGQNPPSALVQAREQARIGLAKLRESHIAARLAREHLLEAATLDGINEEMEDELRRLLAQIGDFLNNRVIP